MANEHPITPPPELVQQWLGKFFGCTVSGDLADSELFLASRASQWGADQELEACCEVINEWFAEPKYRLAELRAARRPKPPSLKEQALEDLEQIDGYAVDQLSAYEIHGDLKRRVSNIRRALEALPDD